MSAHTKIVYSGLCYAFLVALCLSAGPASSRVIPHKPCALDTTKVETAMESAAELAMLNTRVEDDFHRLLQSIRNLDGRYILGSRRAEWLCEVARQCGDYASLQVGMGRCLRDAMLQHAQELEELLRERQK
jgi:hypothetical protein